MACLLGEYLSSVLSANSVGKKCRRKVCIVASVKHSI